MSRLADRSGISLLYKSLYNAQLKGRDRRKAKLKLYIMLPMEPVLERVQQKELVCSGIFLEDTVYFSFNLNFRPLSTSFLSIKNPPPRVDCMSPPPPGDRHDK
jgi:hypothetical protein